MTDNQEDPYSSRHIVLFPAFNIGDSELFHFLKSIDRIGIAHRVLSICTDDFARAYDMPTDNIIIDDFGSHSILADKIERWSRERGCRITGIMGIDEELRFGMTRMLARRFGLEFHDEITCYLASNKYLQKLAYREHGVPASRFELISELDPESVLRVGFPNVLKVMSGSQSHYIFRNMDSAELVANFRRLKRAVRRVNGDPRFWKQRLDLDTVRVALDPKRQFLLESYVPGEEFSCDFIVQSGAARIVRVTKKIVGHWFGYFKGYRLLNQVELGRNGLDESHLLSILDGIRRALRIREGVCMVDFKLHGGEITVLEASIRPGLSAFNHLMHDVYGYTSLTLMAMQKLGMPVPETPPEAQGTVIYLYDSPGAGIDLPDDPGIDFSQGRHEITATHLYREEPSEALDSEIDHSSILKGYVVLRELEGSLEEGSSPSIDALAACSALAPPA